MDISFLKKIVLLTILMFGTSACSTSKVNMSEFDIHQFDDVSKKCSRNTQCKVVKINSYNCGGYESLVYSTLKISDENENYLLKLGQKRIQEDKLKMSKTFQEICTAVAPKPSKGVCWKKGCEIIRTWR